MTTGRRLARVTSAAVALIGSMAAVRCHIETHGFSLVDFGLHLIIVCSAALMLILSIDGGRHRNGGYRRGGSERSIHQEEEP